MVHKRRFGWDKEALEKIISEEQAIESSQKDLLDKSGTTVVTFISENNKSFFEGLISRDSHLF